MVTKTGGGCDNAGHARFSSEPFAILFRGTQELLGGRAADVL